MPTTRRLQWNSHLDLYFCTIPKVLVETIGLKKGDNLAYSLKDNSIILTPEVTESAKTVTSEGRANSNKGSGGE